MLYNIYKVFSHSFFSTLQILLLLLFCSDIFTWFKTKGTNYTEILLEITRKRTRKIFVLLVSSIYILSTFLGNKSVVHFLGERDPRTLHSGTYCYYVIAHHNESQKTYTLPAEITVRTEDGKLFFHVDKVFFKNGGYLDLDYHIFSDIGDFIEYGESEELQDQNFQSWTISLTNHKSYHHAIIESSLYYSWDIATVIFSIIAFILSAFFTYKELHNCYT